MMIASLLASLFAATTPVQSTTTPVVTTPRVKRYCIIDRREGSLRKGKICRTRAEWQARGFDPVVVLGRE